MLFRAKLFGASHIVLVLSSPSEIIPTFTSGNTLVGAVGSAATSVVQFLNVGTKKFFTRRQPFFLLPVSEYQSPSYSLKTKALCQTHVRRVEGRVLKHEIFVIKNIANLQFETHPCNGLTLGEKHYTSAFDMLSFQWAQRQQRPTLHQH